MKIKTNAILFASSAIFCFASLILSYFFFDVLIQNIVLISLFAMFSLVPLVINIIRHEKNKNVTWTLFYGFITSVVATLIITSIPAVGNISNNVRHHKAVSNIKQTSTLVLSTDYVDLYVDPDNMLVYSVCDIDGEKYIDQKNVVKADDSEFYHLFNIGIEIKHKQTTSAIEEVFLYNPTPFTTTGCEYLLEYVYNDVRYVSRVFLTGIIDYNSSMFEYQFAIHYNNGSIYNVSKIADYILFENVFSSFTTSFFNVKYNKDEYFYVRYNRYLNETWNEKNDILDESNVKFVSSFTVMSPLIDKVTFYVIGEEHDGVFEASFPLIEIVYDNGTSDIAVIKDIDMTNIKQIVG